MTAVLRLGDDHVVYAFSPENPPAISVKSGTVLEVDVRDAYDRQFQKSPDVGLYLREGRSRPNNPMTGPIFVEGVEPGDGIDVAIEKIEVGPTGYVAAVPGIGVLGDTEIVPRISRFEVRADGLWFEGRVRLRLRPMIGVIGVARASGSIPAMQQGYHGGNMDFNDITEGATVHFPANVAGGLLALGDVHASMGFCEVHSGVNIDAKVILRVVRVAKPAWTRPWFENGREIMTIGVEDRIEDAIREATLGMVGELRRRLGVSHTEAIVLAGASADIRLGQAAKFGIKVSAYAAFPKAAFE